LADTRPHHHKLAVHRRIGSLTLAADLELSSQWTVLFGPSGSGKSSLLRAACGLLGSKGIRFARRQHAGPDLILQDETAFVPTHLRALRWAPQHASLFPHLDVRCNLTFGPSIAPSAHTGAPALDDIIDLFALAPLLHRRPADLSGGERQRVSLARAFAAPGCRLMLLDEPFNGIDHALRDVLLPRMSAWLRDRAIPVLSVTHDVEEALQLKAEVVLLSDGAVQAQGHAATVLAPERERLLRSLAAKP
jgi:molybdate transport system ATP-binding protein